MLSVKTPEEVLEIINKEFDFSMQPEEVSIFEASGRVLAEPVISEENVPTFNRSTVDGYALAASDTFGCSDSIPALMNVKGQVLMGEDGADIRLGIGECAYVPTGGAIPEGADAVVMIEYVEDYKDGTVGIQKPIAPGGNIIFKGDDVFPGKEVLPKGRLLNSADIGALAALGILKVTVSPRPLVDIISTGDELVDIDETPKDGQIRDVNSAMLSAFIQEAGGSARMYGIVQDDEAILRAALEKALDECDMVLISGGSSVGTKDATCRIIEEKGEILLHGIAMKPGKPTILGKADGKPVFGLPGHPVAAFFVSRLFVSAMLRKMLGQTSALRTVSAQISEAVSANHGRAQYMGVTLSEKEGRTIASPVHTKSGLITSLAGTDGFFCIDRDCEGLSAGSEIQIITF